MSDRWRANPFHRVRLGDAAPDRILRYGRDPRVGNAERGREIGHGVWRIGGERLQGEHVAPWSAPHPSRHFSGRLHAFSWLDDLAAVGPSAHAVMAHLIDAWVEQFGDWDELAWDAGLTAERLFAWLCWGRPAFEHGAPERRAALLRSAARQARLLLFSGNELTDRHLASIKAGAALALAGAAGMPEAQRLSEQGEEMLIEACAKQFFADGGHLSRSPEALAEALFDLVAARDALPDPPTILTEALPRLANMLRMLRMGDGGLACFHGGAEGSRASIEAVLARVGGEVRPFQFADRSGYQRLEAGPLRVLFDVGGAPPPSFAEHAHASALAFELSSDSERLIVNVGATRDLKADRREAARATSGHSTLAVADALSALMEEPRRGRSVQRLSGPALDEVRRSSDDIGVTVQGRHDGYRERFGLMHRRYLFVDHVGANLRGIDELFRPLRQKTPAPKHDIPFVARFHLHPGVRARLIDGQGAALIETRGGQRWRLRTDAAEISIAVSAYWGGSAPTDTLQIVLAGLADPMGHGLAPPNRIRWALTRL